MCFLYRVVQLLLRGVFLMFRAVGEKLLESCSKVIRSKSFSPKNAKTKTERSEEKLARNLGKAIIEYVS